MASANDDIDQSDAPSDARDQECLDKSERKLQLDTSQISVRRKEKNNIEEKKSLREKKVKITMSVLREKMKDPSTFPEEGARYLRTLAEYYESLYNQNNSDWTSCLRAHALYTSCSLRDPSEKSAYKAAAFRLMSSKLNNCELMTITESNKQELDDMRRSYKNSLRDIKSRLLPTIDAKDLKNNHKFVTEFTEVVKALSLRITDDIKRFISKLVDQSVRSVGSRPPCGIAFVAIGSIARSEATPYSDVEYFFLIENKNHLDYFRRLAYQTYFMLGNLGETSLKTMNITELKAIDFEDTYVNGIRIDGLGQKAGNIPTGNGMDSTNDLMFTVEDLVKRYQDLSENSVGLALDKGISSDLVDMLSHRTLVWYHGKGLDLFKNIHEGLRAIPQSKNRHERSRIILEKDLVKYNFMPSSIQLDRSCCLSVKGDFYRYPSLLYTGLNNTLNLKAESNWDTINITMPDDKSSLPFKFLLAGALFIRLDACLYYNSQRDQATLLKKTDDTGLYSCHRPLFLLTMGFLYPLKVLVETVFLMKLQVNELSLSLDQFMARCITNCFCFAYFDVVTAYINEFGEEFILRNPKKFLKQVGAYRCSIFLDSVYLSSGLNHRHRKLIDAVIQRYGEEYLGYRQMLYQEIDPTQALRSAKCHLQSVLTYCSDIALIAGSYLRIGNAYIWCKEPDKAETCIEKADEYISSIQRLEPLSYADPHSTNSEQALYFSGHSRLLTGHLRMCQKRFSEAKNLFLESRKVYQQLYGSNVLHPVISISLSAIGIACYNLDEYTECLNYMRDYLEMDRNLNDCGANSDGRAIALQYIGSSLSKQGEHQRGEETLKSSYEMFRIMYGKRSRHPHLTHCMKFMALHYLKIEDFSTALEWTERVCSNYAVAVIRTKEELAELAGILGKCHFGNQNYSSALKSYKESLRYYDEVDDKMLDSTIKIDTREAIKLCHLAMEKGDDGNDLLL